MKKKEDSLVTGLTIFLGYLKRISPDIAEDDRKAIIRTIYLLKKYLPYYTEKQS